MKFLKDEKKQNSLILACGVHWVAPISSEGEMAAIPGGTTMLGIMEERK